MIQRGETSPCKKHVFAFPKKTDVRARWIALIRRKDTAWNPDYFGVCELHFKPNDFVEGLVPIYTCSECHCTVTCHMRGSERALTITKEAGALDQCDTAMDTKTPYLATAILARARNTAAWSAGWYCSLMGSRLPHQSLGGPRCCCRRPPPECWSLDWLSPLEISCGPKPVPELSTMQ